MRVARRAVVRAPVIVACAAFAGGARVKHDEMVYVGAELADVDSVARRAARIEDMYACVAFVVMVAMSAIAAAAG